MSNSKSLRHWVLGKADNRIGHVYVVPFSVQEVPCTVPMSSAVTPTGMDRRPKRKGNGSPPAYDDDYAVHGIMICVRVAFRLQCRRVSCVPCDRRETLISLLPDVKPYQRGVVYYTLLYSSR